MQKPSSKVGRGNSTCPEVLYNIGNGSWLAFRSTMPSTALATQQLNPWSAASRHTTTQISHTRPSVASAQIMIC